MQFTNVMSDSLVEMSAAPTLIIMSFSLLAALCAAFALWRARDARLLGGTLGLTAATGSALAVLGFGENKISVAYALRHVVRVDAAATAMGAFALAAGVVTFLSVMNVRSRVLPSLLAITIGALSALSAAVDAAHLRKMGPLPALENPNCRRVHQRFAGGAPCVPAVDPEGWALNLSAIDASHLGDARFDVVAERGRVSVSRTHAVRVGDQRPAAAFSPVVGERYSYDRRTGGGAVLLFVIPLHSEGRQPGAELVATADVIVDGKAAVVVERRGFDPSEPSLANQRFFVANIDGEAYVRAEQDLRWTPLIVQRDVKAGDPTLLEIDDDVYAHACSVELFPGAHCWCVNSDPALGPIQRAAPMRCTYGPRVDETVGSVIVAIFTAGLIIPSSDGVRYELSASGAGVSLEGPPR